jgi:hypothetical protein
MVVAAAYKVKHWRARRHWPSQDIHGGTLDTTNSVCTANQFKICPDYPIGLQASPASHEMSYSRVAAERPSRGAPLLRQIRHVKCGKSRKNIRKKAEKCQFKSRHLASNHLLKCATRPLDK